MSNESENEKDFDPNSLTAEDLLLWGWINGRSDSIDHMLESILQEITGQFDTKSEWEEEKKKLMRSSWFSHDFLLVIKSMASWFDFDDIEEWQQANPRVYALYQDFTRD